MALSSGRGRKGKAFADIPPLLLQHLPKRARILVSPLSDDDREVLIYMLAFGLHLQMLAGIVLPSERQPQQKFSPFSSKVGSKLELDFPSHSFSPLSSKPRVRPRKPSLLAEHQASCSCGCFSCYSSFWSRWASSPNSDLLSAIIEMAEVADVEEDSKRQRNKDTAKKQVKERATGKRKKTKAETSKLQGLQNTLLPSVSNMDDCTSKSSTFGSMFASASMDSFNSALSKGEGVCSANCLTARPITSSECGCMEAEFKVLADVLMTDAPGTAVALMTKKLPVASRSNEVSSVTPFEQAEISVKAGMEAFEKCAVHATSVDSLQGNDSKVHLLSKRKCNQVMPVDAKGIYPAKAGNEDLSHLGESCDGHSSTNLVVGVNSTDSGVFSRILPHTLRDIVSRIWELVSLGSWNHIESY